MEEENEAVKASVRPSLRVKDEGNKLYPLLNKISTWYHGNFVFSIGTVLPILLWVVLIKKYYLDIILKQSFHYHMITILITFIPVVYCFVYLYFYVFNKDHFHIIRGWDACYNSNINPKYKKMGILATFDWECWNTNMKILNLTLSNTMDRLYYICMAIFTIILIIQNNFKHVIIRNKLSSRLFLNLVTLSLIFGVIGYMTALFVGQGYYAYWWLQIATSALTINITLLLLMVVDLYQFVYRK